MGTILELRNISKMYPGVLALDRVSLSFEAGEVHAIMGENGAGKSTLIKVAAGAETCDPGSEIIIGGRSFKGMTPALAKEHGIGVIYQEFNLVPSLSVAENIFLGDRVGGRMVIDFKAMHRRSAEILSDLGVDIPTDRMVADLSTAQQQLVEIAKEIARDDRVLIMDEPSAALSIAEVENLFRIIDKLKARGITVIYISHRMDEVFRISDRVSVLRNGVYIATRTIAESSRKELITMMVGRELNEDFPTRDFAVGEPVLEVEHLYGNGDFDISFTLRRGEILGVAGLVGAGRTELVKVLYGAEKMDRGQIRLNGTPVSISSPQKAIELGIGLIPEDRKDEGLFQEYTVLWNISISCIKSVSKRLVVDHKTVDQIARDYVDRLRIKTPTLAQKVRNLSGGNQQKVVLAKTLAAKTQIILFDEPTRGIDVGAKQEIYSLMNELVSQGISIIMISSEMEELIGMSDRILVLHEGRLTGELQKGEFSQNRILELASGE